MLKGSIIGLGNVSLNGHLPAWKKSTNVEIVAGVDLDQKRHVLFQDFLPHVKCFSTFSECLAALKLDFVDICTPPHLHFSLARQALEMGLANTVVPYKKLEEETIQWCKEILQHSPLAIRCLKSALNADCDGQAGLQELAGNATMLFYMTEEGQEGRNAFQQKRKPNFSKFPKRP